MAKQLPLSLPLKTALGRDNYFVSDANALAVTSIEGWQLWPQGKLVLTGPKGAGKTHLANIWAEDTGATALNAWDLAGADMPSLMQNALLVEDIDLLVGDMARQTALFHLYNLSQAEGVSVLMTTGVAPGRLQLELPDLKSRLQSVSVATLGAIDEPLLTAILVKLFADRQIQTSAKLLDYVLPRIERSFVAAQNFVREIDARALAEDRKIGPRLAREILSPDLDNLGKNTA